MMRCPICDGDIKTNDSIPETHNCIIELISRINDLYKKVYDLEDRLSSVHYMVDPDDRRFH